MTKIVVRSSKPGRPRRVPDARSIEDAEIAALAVQMMAERVWEGPLVEDVEVCPFPGRPPKNPVRYADQWAQALKVCCPVCGRPPGRKCINLAPSHREAGVAYETKWPHKGRN